MIKLIKTVFTLLVCVSSVAQNDDSFSQELLKVNDTCIVILPFKRDANWAWHLKGCKFLDVNFLLVASRMESLKKLLEKTVIKHNNNPYSGMWGDDIYIRDYYIQIVGGINSREEIVFWVNCLHYSRMQGNFKWKNEIIRAHHGGKYFFNVIINLTRMTAESFYVNGY